MIADGTNYPVLIDISPTVANLEIDAIFSASLNNNQSLTIAGGAGAGSLNIVGTLSLNSVGNNIDPILGGTSGSTITLSGGGTLSVSDNFANRIYSSAGDTLVNSAGNTIQGSGQFGLGGGGNAFTLNNNGAVVANQSISLILNPGNGVTNNGTLEANSGDKLVVADTLSNYNGTTSTLTGGSYNAFSGTIQLNPASVSGGHVIATNDATILLDGTGTITDASGNNLLQGHLLTNNGSFTIQNGANLTSAASADFSNAGTLTLSANSTFTLGSDGHNFDNTGTLRGVGTLQGNLVNSSGGLVMPGLPGTSGTLTIMGSYSDPQGGTIDFQIGGIRPGAFSVLDITGTASLTDSSFEVNLINGFTPIKGETFQVLDSAGLMNTTFLNGSFGVGRFLFTPAYINGDTDVLLTVTVSGAVPEPASVVMLGLGVAGLAVYAVRKSRKAGRARS